ncbi:MAG: alkaline phosphatase [Clostridia bacterium]|nr:alkaline phosphatase [Clostridia bacterium]
MTKRYKHTVVIGIDGMGNYNRNANTPNIDSLFENGAVTYDALSMDPTISAENWGAMLIGCNPSVHQLTNSIVDRFPYENKDLPTVFARIRKEYPDAYLAACSNWDPINRGIIEQDAGVDLITADDDELLCAEIEKVIEKKPDFLFIQFDNVDGAGHHFWYGTEGHIKQIEKTDDYVLRIAEAYKKAGIFDDTLFICLADHGGIRGGHGGYTKEERFIYFAVTGKGIEKSQMGFAQTKDVAALVLYAFGIDIPQFEKAGFSSQIPDNIFTQKVNDYIAPAPQKNNIKTRVTPAFKSEQGLASFFDEKRIKLAMFFDDEIKDETGKNKFTEHGTIKYYSTGVFGARAELGKTGYAVTEDLKFKKDSFALAFWIKLDSSLNEEVCVCSTQDWFWKNRSSRGFTQTFCDGDTRFSVADGDGRLELVTPYHDDVSEGWLHNITVFDKEKSELRIYHNFKLVRVCALEERHLCDMDNLPFTVGNDGANQHNDKYFNFIFNMDDLFIFDGSFTENDVENLKKYYNF